MNCSAVRPLLPLALYGDVSPADAETIATHLAGCADCRSERQALERVRKALDLVQATPTEPVRVPQLFEALQHQAQRRARGWRWAALFALATAAALAFLAFAARFELRAEDHQLVFRWGNVPDVPRSAERPDRQADSVTAADRQVAPLPRDVAEQVALLSQIVRTLVRDGQEQDDRQKEEIARLQMCLDELQRRTDYRLTDAEKDLRTLYKAQFVLREKGAGL